MADLSVGVVGAGSIATGNHIPAFESNPDTEVLSVCDPDGERREAAAKEWDIPHTHESLDPMLDAHDIHIVDICSPPMYHFEQATAALRSGADVLMEKPMVSSIDEADRLRECQLETGGKLSIIHNRKFRSSVARPRKLVADGEIGKVHTIEVKRFVSGEDAGKISDPTKWEHDLRGGRWEEILPHHLYQPWQFVDEMEVLSVHSKSINDAFKPHLIADEVSIELAHERGYVLIRYTTNANDKLREMTIHGADGKIITDAASTATLHRFGSEAEDISGDDEQMSHAIQIDRFVDYVQGREENPVSWEEAYATMELLDQISRKLRAQYEARN
jgi:predicted dehydrogenase